MISDFDNSRSLQAQPENAGDFSVILRKLRDVRRRAVVTLVCRRLALLITTLLTVGVIAGFVDYLLHWPRELRVALWFCTLLIVGLVSVRRLWAALTFHPSLTDLALRIEQLEPAARGWLASGTDLALKSRNGAGSTAVDSDEGLTNAVIADAASRLKSLHARSILRRSGAYASGGALAAGFALLILLTSLWPASMNIGFRRVVTPWTSLDWPKRTGVIDATYLAVHPRSSALALRAGLTRSDHPAAQTQVWAVYHLERDGQSVGQDRRVYLTCQDRPVDSTDPALGTLFERLIEPAGFLTDLLGDAAATTGSRVSTNRSETTADDRHEFAVVYWFETTDDRSAPSRVLLVDPPGVVSASLTVTLPEYALPIDGSSSHTPTAIDLGPGIDDRAASEPILLGSRIELLIELNKAVPIPQLSSTDLSEPQTSAWIAQTLGSELAQALADPVSSGLLDITPGSTRWKLSWRLLSTLRLDVRLTDEHQISSVDESRFIIHGVKDNLPTCVMLAPSDDRAVLSTAIIDLAAEARDDVGVASLSLERQHARRPSSAGSPPPAPEPIEDRVIFSTVEHSSGATISPRTLESRLQLDLSTLDLNPGDELWLTALAADAYELDGDRHQPVRSSIRKIRILSRQELVEQIWSELGTLRRSAIALDQDQDKTVQQLDQPGLRSAEQAARAQIGLTERLTRQEDSLDRAQRQMEANQFQDDALERLLDEARNALRAAQSHSADAAQSAQAAAGAEAAAAQSLSGSPQAQEQTQLARDQRQQARDSQQDVRSELADLIEMLDQGQDAWASRRSLERLIEEQKRLADRTEKLGEQTAGKQPEDLTPEQLKELDELAGQQSSAAQSVRDAVEKMLERQEQLSRNDPASAQGMENAAQRSRKEGLADRQEEAARQIGRNQTNNARQQQSRALQTLQDMLADIDQGVQNRDQVLRRQLASLIDSIRALIEQQRVELAALETAIAPNSPESGLTNLGAGMGRLHQNTLGVLEQTRSGPREAAAAARSLERAASAQQRATLALADAPVNVDEALDGERESLRFLLEAIESVEKIDQQAQDRQEARLRDQIKQEYAKALERQTTIRDATALLIGAESSRRTRNSARLLSQDQESLRADLENLRQQTQELRDAKVFEFAHQRLDEQMKSAALSLDQGLADAQVARRQNSSIKILSGLIDVLDSRSKKNKPFREQEQAGNQGGGGDQQDQVIPEAAELRLLRAMQLEALEFTRELSQNPGAASVDIAEAVKLQRDLADQARELLERVNKKQFPSPLPTGTPDPDQRPVDDSQPGAGA